MAIRIMDSIKTANDTTDFPVSYAKDVWLNKDKSGTTEDYSDLQTMYNNDLLGSGGSSIQVDTMPMASVDELGKIYEFIGSTGTYINGYFYECVSDGEPTPTYSWVQKNVQPNAESFTFNSDEFAVDSTINEVSLKPSYADIPSFLPNNVSSSNKLATNSSITAITNLIPSDASASNKLVTQNDALIYYQSDSSSITDFNNAVPRTGKGALQMFYLGSDLTNAPTSSGGGFIVIAKQLSTTYISQLATQIGTNNTYTRSKSTNGWTHWQQLVTNDDIFLVGDRQNTIGWADLSNSVDIDGSSNFANNIGRIEGHNALIEVSNPSTGYQWPVTNSGDNNAFVDFGGALQFFTDKVNNHLYIRFANSVDMSAWGEVATIDKVAD